MSLDDRLIGLKYVGLCYSHMPPEEADFEFADFVKYAKFHLCNHTKTLMKDPIWDTYTAEEIIAEYYAVLFSKSTEQKEKFENELLGNKASPDSFADWADSEIKQNGKDLDVLDEELEDSISFNPATLGE